MEARATARAFRIFAYVIRRLLPFSLLFFALSAKGQETPAISPIITFDYGSPLFINRAAGVFNHSSVPDTGISSAFSYGLGMRGAIGLSGPIGLLGRVSGIYSTGQFNSSLGGGDTVSGHEWKLLAEALLDWKPSAISLRAGPWLSARIAGTILANHPGSFFASAQSPSIHYGLAAGLAWDITHFPIEPELTTHIDLTELSEAGAKAWSVGLSLAYKFGGEEHTLASPKMTQAKSWATPPVPASVKFLVNGSPSQGSPPLERVETRIKEYRMIDSANAAPNVSQWIDESYHLPRLAISFTFRRGRGAYLMLFKDSLRLLEKTFPGAADSLSRTDTLLDLDRDSAWQNILAHLNTGENNRLIAELLTNSKTVRDTLLLPPADTSRAVQTIVRREFRFELSDNYGRYKGGAQSLDLLLGRMKELMDSTNAIRIQEGIGDRNPTGRAALETKLKATLGNRWKDVPRVPAVDGRQGLLVIMDR